MRRTKRNNRSSIPIEMSYELNDTIPVLSIKGSEIRETPKKLFKGTIVKGFLKNRVVNFKGRKMPFKFIQLKNESGYLTTKGVDLYIPLDGFNSSNFDAVPIPTDLITDKKDDKETGKTVKKNNLIAYGLPAIAGVLGWQIAKKMDLDFKNKIAVSVVCLLLGTIPNYLYKNKQK